MSLRGVVRIVAGIVRDWARGVALCTVGAVGQARTDLHGAIGRVREDLHTFTHLPENIHDACSNSLDDRLAGYEAHAWPHEDLTARDNVGWR